MKHIRAQTLKIYLCKCKLEQQYQNSRLLKHIKAQTLKVFKQG